MVRITFPDGRGEEFKKGVTGLEIAKKIGERLAQAALAIQVNGNLQDLSVPIEKDAKVRIITFKDKEGVEIFRHSSAHILAAAVVSLFKNAKPTIGPSVEDGFYYDFDHAPFTTEDLAKIEKKMQEIISKDLKFERIELTKEKAKTMFKENKYKLELIEEYGKELSAYKIGDFVDLCRGPHVPSTGKIKAVKLTKLASAYWRADEKNKQLQRIYGISFPENKELEEFLKMIEEAVKRDHVRLGKELDLYVVNPAIGQGLPLLTPKGTAMMMTLRRWIEDEEIKRGYQYTITPVLAKTDLYKISGHLEHYKDKMFIFNTDEKEEVALRPMTCPYQFMIYKSKMRSYRELPIRYAETSQLFRKEKSGEMHGLIRIWQFTLADAHLICKPEQVEKEFEGVLDLIKYVMKTLGLDSYWYRFSKWDPKDKQKYINNPKAWEQSQAMMKKILDKNKLKYVEAEGEAAFYGPKLDVQMKNVWGKEDTMFTVQIDFALPEKFDMTYEGEDGAKHRPMVIHRSSIGCYERTMAMLIEKYAGKFPLWLNPNQIRILPIADRHVKYAEEIHKKLFDAGVRVEIDSRSESTPKKVRDAEMQHYNYILVVGDKEIQNKTVNVRTRDNKILGEIKADEFLKQVLKEIEVKK